MASCSGGLCFHGAFNKKSDAERKKKRVGKKAFILKKWIVRRTGARFFRYIVAERDSAVEFNFGGR